MSNPLRTAEDYELFLYTLVEDYPTVRHSTLTFVRRGASFARVSGELSFDHGLRLVVRERLIFDRLPVTIDWYGYEVWRGEEQLYWYDPQPHPNDPALQSSYPHHKHLPPNIKQSRIPAPRMSFTRSNLPELIREIEELIEGIERDTQQR
jgi:hypothetical protein